MDKYVDLSLDGIENNLDELTEVELSLVGGGTGDISLGDRQK